MLWCTCWLPRPLSISLSLLMPPLSEHLQVPKHIRHLIALLRLHWSYQYSPEWYSSLLQLLNNLDSHVKRPCCVIYTKTCRKTEITLEHSSVCAPYPPIVNFSCLLSSTCPCHRNKLFWLSFFLSPDPLLPHPCSSVMYAVLAIIKLAGVRCFEYGTDECIINQCISRTSYTKVSSHLLCLSSVWDVNLHDSWSAHLLEL